MLLNNLFLLNSISASEQSIIASFTVDIEHPILKGHFPSQAVVPGVCMIELVKEILQNVTKIKLQLETSAFAKFLTLFAPSHFTTATLNIQYSISEQQKFSVNATIQHEQTIFLKFKGVYSSI